MTTIAVVAVPPVIPCGAVRGVCPQIGADGHTVEQLLVPPIPLGDTHFMVTVLYDLLRFGVPWAALRERYRLPARLTRQMIVDYIFTCGRKIYGGYEAGRGYVGYTVLTEWPGMDMPIRGAQVPWPPAAED